MKSNKIIYPKNYVTASRRDNTVKSYVSELLYKIQDPGLQQVLRTAIFVASRDTDWRIVEDSIHENMPEHTIELDSRR